VLGPYYLKGRNMCAGVPFNDLDVFIKATVQVCAQFPLTRRIASYEVEDCPPWVWRFITGSSFLPDEAQEVFEELILKGYRITLVTRKEYVSALDAVNWFEI
jgi:hypothetical protein